MAIPKLNLVKDINYKGFQYIKKKKKINEINDKIKSINDDIVSIENNVPKEFNITFNKWLKSIVDNFNTQINTHAKKNGKQTLECVSKEINDIINAAQEKIVATNNDLSAAQKIKGIIETYNKEYSKDIKKHNTLLEYSKPLSKILEENILCYTKVINNFFNETSMDTSLLNKKLNEALTTVNIEISYFKEVLNFIENNSFYKYKNDFYVTINKSITNQIEKIVENSKNNYAIYYDVIGLKYTDFAVSKSFDIANKMLMYEKKILEEALNNKDNTSTTEELLKTVEDKFENIQLEFDRKIYKKSKEVYGLFKTQFEQLMNKKLKKIEKTIEDYLSIIEECKIYKEIPELSNLYNVFYKIMTIVKNKHGKLGKNDYNQIITFINIDKKRMNSVPGRIKSLLTDMTKKVTDQTFSPISNSDKDTTVILMCLLSAVTEQSSNLSKSLKDYTSKIEKDYTDSKKN